MAITFVGSKTFTHAAITAQSVSLTDLKDTSGANATLQIGDYVVVTYVLATTTTNRTAVEMTPTGYTAAHTDQFSDDSNDTNLLVSYKKLTAVDTTVSIPASSATTMGCAVEIRALRGIDATTPLDVTPVVASGINTGVANAGAITPASPGALITVHGGAAVAAGAAFTNPSGLSATTNHFKSDTLTTTTNDPVVGVGMKTDWTSGAFDPATFGGSTGTNTGSWAAATIAWRPALAAILAGGAPVEADDTAVGAAVSPIKAGSSTTEADDTAVGTATVADPVAHADASITEADDVAAGAVVTPDKATASVTEADDTAVGAVAIPGHGVASIVEADDTAAGAVVTPDKAAAGMVEADDTGTGIATTPDKAVASLTEADDTGTGAVVIPGRGTGDIVEADDTAVGTAAIPNRAGGDIVEADDISAATGATPIKASSSTTEADDTAAGAVATPDRAVAGMVEADDVAVGEFAVGDVPLQAVGAYVEADDTAAGAVVTPDRAVAGMAEADDTAVGAVAVPIYGTFAANDNDDTAVGAVAIPDRAAATITEADDIAVGVIGTPVVWDIPPSNVAAPIDRSRVPLYVANRFRSVITSGRRNRSTKAA